MKQSSILPTLLAALLLPVAASAQGDVKRVVVEGVGPTVEEARKNAVRAAVVATVGEMVDAETLVENDDVVQDQILTYSNGYVDTMEVLSTKTDASGFVTLRVRADVRKSQLQRKLTEVMSTTADADGESLFAEMLSRQNSVEDADKMFAKVFAGHREDMLLEAGVVLREDGKPAIELEPNTGKVTVSVRLAVNDTAWNAWMSDAQKRFEVISEKSEPAETRHAYNEERWDGPEIVVGDRRFFFKKDYTPTVKKRIEAVPRRQWVRIALVDRVGWTIAAEYVETHNFRGSQSPLDFYDSYGRGRFTVSSPVSRDIVFEGLSLADLKETSKVVCLVGERNELMITDTDKALAYHKTHPNKKIIIGDVSFKMAQLSPRLLVGTTEVTQALWETIMGENPSRHKKNSANPVETVSWDDCQAFLKKLNEWPGIRESGLEFRLPREEEWEFACRAGSAGTFCKLADGTDITENTLGKVAWYGDGTGSHHPVGQKKPNVFGLYDMHGNVWEWTSPVSSSFHVCGGDWGSPANGGGCESDSRWECYPDCHSSEIGFRLFASEHFAGRSGADALPPQSGRIKIVVTDGIAPEFQNDLAQSSDASDRENGSNEKDANIKGVSQDLENRSFHRPRKEGPDNPKTARGKRKAVVVIALGVLAYFSFRSASKKRS